MSTSSTRVRAEQSELVCKGTDGDADDEEVTFFEPDRDPDRSEERRVGKEC